MRKKERRHLIGTVAGREGCTQEHEETAVGRGITNVNGKVNVKEGILGKVTEASDLSILHALGCNTGWDRK